MFWEPPCFLVEWVILAHHLHSLPCSKISHFFVLSAWLLLGDSGIQNANFAYYLRCHRAKYICCINTYTNTHVWRRQWQPNPVLLPGKSHGWRKLVGCSPWGHEESDMTEWLHCHFSPSCTGEGNGNPLQCPCLENPGLAEPGGLLSMGSHRVRHDWSDLAAVVAHTCTHICTS